MKKAIFCFFFILIFCLFSCNNNTNTPSKDENSTQKSYVPIFKTEVNSRGLIDMEPEGNPFTNMKDASNIMTSLPLMVGISEQEGSFDSLTQNLSKQNGIGDLGFDIKLDIDKSKLLSDGSSFLMYNVYEDNQNVGFIEYVYNPNTKSFSYRQSVMLTICANMGSGDVPIIVSPYTVEYINIPLNISNGKISYVIGEYKDNKFIDNGIADFIMLQYANNNSLEFQRQILSSKFDNGIYYSVYRPTSFIKNLDTKEEDFEGILRDTTNNIVTNLPISTTEQAKTINIDTLNRFIKFAYKSGDKIVSHNYSSFDDFNAASIIEYKFEADIKPTVFAENPVCYDTIYKKTASSKYMNPTYSPAFKYILSYYNDKNIPGLNLYGTKFENNDNFGFSHFGYTLENNVDSKKAFIKKHLMNCGIPEGAITEEFLNNYRIKIDEAKNNSCLILFSKYKVFYFNVAYGSPISMCS